jgi:phosphatidylinositol glycan class K
VPDDRIVLMLADCSGCDPRNPRPGAVLAAAAAPSVLTAATQVDYRGRDVSAASLLRVLADDHPPGTPPSRRLRAGRNASVLLYLTGHGGDGFLKFHDREELLAADVAAAVGGMAAAGRYGRLLLVADTCQAASLYAGVRAPRWAGVASSAVGQSSYAAHSDPGVGAHLVDEFTLHLAGFLGRLPARGAGATLAQLLRHVRAQRPLSSRVDVRAGGLGRDLGEVRAAEFFGDDGAAAAVEAGAGVAAARRRGRRGAAGGGGEAGSCVPRPAGAALLTLADTLLGAWPGLGAE